MARNMYGATSADFTLTSGGRVVPGATLTVWTARTGGTQVTDLLDADSVACTTVTSGADGSVVFYGPDAQKDTYWLDSGQGSRIAVRPVDITGETGATPALTIGTVTTGTAAATLTGTDEDPVLSLVLPSAGTDGVNTAAIQAKAVTAAKIADDTITATQIAANAVGSSELADGAVTAAKIADGAILNADINASAGIAASKIAGTALTHAFIDAKGDLVTGSSADTPARLPVGTDGQMLVADSTQATGLRWASRFNLLTAQQAAGDGGWDSNGTIAYGTPGDSVFTLVSGWTYIVATSRVPVKAGDMITWRSELAPVGGSAYAVVTFHTAVSGGSQVGPGASGNVISSGASGLSSIATVVPAGAVAAEATIYASGSPAVTVTRPGLWQGAGGRWAMPGTPIVGMSAIAVNDAVDLSGTGSPKGVVVAAPGSTWLQTDATTDVKGWIKWIKATGTGNTGWVAGPEADTGWRSITLENGWTGTLLIVRRGRRVSVKFLNLTGTSGTGAYTLPSGFCLGNTGPGSADHIAVYGNGAGCVEISSTAGVNALEILGSAKGWVGTYCEASWETDDGWPSSLPGGVAA